jgi:hypothetical protein
MPLGQLVQLSVPISMHGKWMILQIFQLGIQLRLILIHLNAQTIAMLLNTKLLHHVLYSVQVLFLLRLAVIVIKLVYIARQEERQVMVQL